MECPSCGAATREGQRFCADCGQPLAQACPTCGAGVGPTQRFCADCGTELSVAAPAGPRESPIRGPQPVPAGAEMRTVSVLFVDLVGFTTLAEGRDPEDVRELLSRYFDTARTIVGRHGGTIEKFIGDAVMAVWGVPTAREDDAERAVRAGLELVDAVMAFGAEAGLADLRARAGVVTGRAAAVDSPEEGIVAGDRVNTAARVQGVAQPGTVCVDEVTRQVTSSSIAYSDAGEHVLKGKAEPMRLWRADRVVAGVAGSQRTGGIEAPFTGRDPELRLLKDLFHTAADRRTARLVAVSGPAGVGKSRLGWEFEKYMDGLSDVVLWHRGRCLAYGEGVAYWALAEMVRGRFGISEEESDAEAARQLDEGLERWITEPDERAYLAPRLGALLGVADPGLGREELFAGWRLLFERLAETAPVALCFEDLQWADAGLLDFIEHVLEWSAQQPIFVLTFARPELAERREGWGAGRRGAAPIYLDPLDDAAMRELLDGMVEGLPAGARTRIVEQANGIPLYAIETVRALADRGVLAASEGGRFTVAGDLGQLDVPASLSSLLAARLDALEPDERELVRAMCVFGGSWPRAAAAALSGLPDDRLDEVLVALVRKEVLVVRADPTAPDRGQYAFAQTLLRTVAYDTLSKRERKPRHLAAAAHLRATFSGDGEDVAEVLAAHYLEAYRAAPEDPDADSLRAEALAALRRAAHRAASVGAPEAAERAHRDAAELTADEAERAELLTAAGDMAATAGRYEAALELFAAAKQLHEEAGRDREAAVLAANVSVAQWGLGRHEEGIAPLRAALEATDTGEPDADVAVLNVQLGRSLTFTGRFQEAGGPLDAALTAAEALGELDVLTSALVAKGTLYLFIARWREAVALLSAGTELARERGLSGEEQRGMTNVANAVALMDRPESRERAEAALAVTRRGGSRSHESLIAANLCSILLFTGRWGEIDRLVSELMPADGDGRPLGEYLHERLLQLHALRGDAAAVREDLANLGAWARTDDPELREAYAVAKGIASAVEDGPPAALETLLPLTRTALESTGTDENLRYAWAATLDALFALGRIDEAEELVEMLARRPPGRTSPYLRAQRDRARAIIAAARGEHEAAGAWFRATVDALRALDYRYWLARAQTDYAAWLMDQGRRDEAAPLLEEAIGVLEDLGAAPALERARGLREAAPVAVPD